MQNQSNSLITEFTELKTALLSPLILTVTSHAMNLQNEFFVCLLWAVQ